MLITVSILLFFYSRNELWKDIKEISTETVIGEFKDWRILVFINSHNQPRGLHTGNMLNGPGYSYCKIEFWRDHFSTKPHLVGIIHPFCFNGRTACANSPVKKLCKSFEHLETLFSFQSLPAGDDDIEFLDILLVAG